MECIGLSSVFPFVRLAEMVKNNSLASAEICVGFGFVFPPSEYFSIGQSEKALI